MAPTTYRNFFWGALAAGCALATAVAVESAFGRALAWTLGGSLVGSGGATPLGATSAAEVSAPASSGELGSGDAQAPSQMARHRKRPAREST